MPRSPETHTTSGFEATAVEELEECPIQTKVSC